MFKKAHDTGNRQGSGDHALLVYVQPCALTNGTETGQRRVNVHCFSRDRQGQRARLLLRGGMGIEDMACPDMGRRGSRLASINKDANKHPPPRSQHNRIKARVHRSQTATSLSITCSAFSRKSSRFTNCLSAALVILAWSFLLRLSKSS